MRAPLALRIYGALLRVLPRTLRDRHAAEMHALFREQWESARQQGVLPAIGVWSSAATDLARGAAYEHWRRRGRRVPRERHVSSTLADLRFALRSFRHQPGSTALVVFTLALAVAASTAVFTLLDGVFFRPFPFTQPNQLVYLNERAPRWNLEFTGINYRDFATWRDRAQSFQAMAAMGSENVNLTSGQSVERVNAAMVTYDFPTVLDIQPVVGRFFTREEDRPDGPKVVAIGYGLWQTRFGGRLDVVGQELRVNSAPYTIVGVFPPKGEFPNDAKVWLPLDGNPNALDQSYMWDGIARLKPGVTIAQAAKDLELAHQPVWLTIDTARAVSPRVMPLRDFFVGDYRAIGTALGAGVVLVLLIACANVAGAMLARSVFRRREIGIRLALGASATRITRQLLTESVVIAAIASAIGAAAGVWAMRALLAINPDFVPKWAPLDVGPRTVLFSIAIMMATAVLFGLAPAIRLRNEDVRAALTSAATRMTVSLRDRRLLNGLVVFEIALAVVLLAGGGLLLRAYNTLRHVEPGFRPDGVTMFRVPLPAASYKNGTAQMAFYDNLLERVRAMPGVDHAALVTCPPFGCHWGNFYKAEGAPPLERNQTDPVTLTRFASPDYFAAMEIRFTHGRPYAEHEGSARTGFRPVVINEELAHRLWPTVADPTGQRLSSRGDTSSNWSTVVGVVRDVKHYGLARPMIPGLYFPTTRIDSTSEFDSFAFAVHTRADPLTLFQPIQAAVRSLDPEVPVTELHTGPQLVQRALASAKTVALVLSAFAAIALALAVGGIYAMLSYVVGRRRHEIGIRMALGAQRVQVSRLVVRQGMVLVAIGVVIGVPAALVAAGVLSSLLVGVSPRDPVTYTAVVLVLAATAAIAAWIPARRAARVDPKIALSEGG